MKLKSLVLTGFLIPFLALAQQPSGGFSLDALFNTIQGKVDGLVNAVNPMTAGAAVPRAIPQEWIASNALAVGQDHVLYLTKSGKVYGWGSNRRGQLAQGKSEGKSPTVQEIVSFINTDFTRPVLVPIDGVIAVYAAGHSSYALKPDGSVWSWGESNYAGRGLFKEDSIDIDPAKIEGLPPIAKLAPFGKGVRAYDVNGKVWVWGNADQTAMLQGTEFRSVDAGTPIASRLGAPLDVRSSANGNATYLLASDGSLWNPSHMRGSMSNLKFEKLFGDSFFYAGVHYARTTDGKIYQWRDGDAERFSDGRERHPIQLIDKVGDPLEIVSGNNFSVFLQSDGTLFVWGGGGNYPFLTGMRSAQYTPQPVKIVEKIVAIKGHPMGIFVLTESGAVLKHNATAGEAVSMKKSRGDSRMFTELVRPDQLSD